MTVNLRASRLITGDQVVWSQPNPCNSSKAGPRPAMTNARRCPCTTLTCGWGSWRRVTRASGVDDIVLTAVRSTITPVHFLVLKVTERGRERSENSAGRTALGGQRGEDSAGR